MRKFQVLTGFIVMLSLIPKLGLIAQSADSLDLGPLMEPDPIKFSFDAPGWYIVAGILLTGMVLLFLKWIRNYFKNAYRRDAIKNLIALKDQDLNGKIYLSDLLTLLKIVAIKTYGRNKVAHLHGDEWISFLETHGKNTAFTQYQDVIANAIYSDTSIDQNVLSNISKLSIKWIKTHA